MKTILRKSRFLAVTLIALGLFAGGAQAEFLIDFEGGDGAPLSITLPSIFWEVTNASGPNGFNGDAFFGIAIFGTQSSGLELSGNAIGATGSDFSSSSNGSLTFSPGAGTFWSNFEGKIIWFGMTSSQNAINDDIITFAGGTLNSTGNATNSYTDGMYDIYLTNSGGIVVSGTATAVPEPSISLLFGFACLILAVKRSRRRISIPKDC